MNLLELIDYFKEMTGRYDFTKSQCIRYLNQGQVYLESRYNREGSLTEYRTVLPSYTRTFRIPNCVAIHKVGLRTSTQSDFYEVKRKTTKYASMVAQNGYGHFYGVSYNGNVIHIDNKVENIKQDFLISGFRIGQTLNVFEVGDGEELTLESQPEAMPFGEPIITYVDRDQIRCDSVIPNAGGQVVLLGKNNYGTESSDNDNFTYTEITTAKRLNSFNIKSIVPGAFTGIVVLNKAIQSNQELEVLYQGIEPLLEDEDESWWSVNYAGLLIDASDYMLEKWYRNFTSMKEKKTEIDEALMNLFADDTKRRKIVQTSMNVPFTLG